MSSSVYKITFNSTTSTFDDTFPLLLLQGRISEQEFKEMVKRCSSISQRHIVPFAKMTRIFTFVNMVFVLSLFVAMVAPVILMNTIIPFRNSIYFTIALPISFVFLTIMFLVLSSKFRILRESRGIKNFNSEACAYLDPLNSGRFGKSGVQVLVKFDTQVVRTGSGRRTRYRNIQVPYLELVLSPFDPSQQQQQQQGNQRGASNPSPPPPPPHQQTAQYNQNQQHPPPSNPQQPQYHQEPNYHYYNHHVVEGFDSSHQNAAPSPPPPTYTYQEQYNQSYTPYYSGNGDNNNQNQYQYTTYGPSYEVPPSGDAPQGYTSYNQQNTSYDYYNNPPPPSTTNDYYYGSDVTGSAPPPPPPPPEDQDY